MAWSRGVTTISFPRVHEFIIDPPEVSAGPDDEATLSISDFHLPEDPDRECERVLLSQMITEDNSNFIVKHIKSQFAVQVTKLLRKSHRWRIITELHCKLAGDTEDIHDILSTFFRTVCPDLCKETLMDIMHLAADMDNNSADTDDDSPDFEEDEEHEEYIGPQFRINRMNSTETVFSQLHNLYKRKDNADDQADYCRYNGGRSWSYFKAKGPLTTGVLSTR